MCQPLQFTARHVEFAKAADYSVHHKGEDGASEQPGALQMWRSPASNKPVSPAKRARTSCLTFISGGFNRLVPSAQKPCDHRFEVPPKSEFGLSFDHLAESRSSPALPREIAPACDILCHQLRHHRDDRSTLLKFPP
jgi:hypothetical protein